MAQGDTTLTKMTDDKMRFRELLKPYLRHSTFCRMERDNTDCACVCGLEDAVSRAYELGRGADEGAVMAMLKVKQPKALGWVVRWNKQPRYDEVMFFEREKDAAAYLHELEENGWTDPEIVGLYGWSDVRAALLAAFPNAKEPGE